MSMQFITKVAGNKMNDNIYKNMSKKQIIDILEQVRWERDTAIDQLRNDYEVSFGEKYHTTKWIWNKDCIDWNIGCWECKSCGAMNTMLSTAPEINPMQYSASNYCPHCGAKVVGYESL